MDKIKVIHFLTSSLRGIKYKMIEIKISKNRCLNRLHKNLPLNRKFDSIFPTVTNFDKYIKNNLILYKIMLDVGYENGSND